MITFLEFMNKHGRDAIKHLKLIKQVLEKNSLKVVAHIGFFDDPYLWVEAPGNIAFGGVRIYEIGEGLAFRLQKQSGKEPHGEAIKLPIEDMFNDLLGDNPEDDQIGQKVADYVVREIKQFFKDSERAELMKVKKDNLDKIVSGKSASMDYSSMMSNSRY